MPVLSFLIACYRDNTNVQRAYFPSFLSVLPGAPYFANFFMSSLGEGTRFIGSLRLGFAEIVKDCMASSSRNLAVYLKKEINDFL